MDSVLNWIWQGIIVALATSALFAVPRTPARVRYVAAAIALLAVLLLPLAARLPARSHHLAAPVGSAIVAGEAMVVLPSRWWTADWFLLSLWSVWATVAGARMMAGLVALGRARRSCRPFPADVERRLPQWRAIRTTRRRARLVLSEAVRTAAVFGGRDPLIAVAPTLVATLGAGDLDRVVVHEWAHVQWRDDRVHRVQAWIRVLAGWHPAVWWLDRQIHFEREIACDEQAVRLTGSPRAYASCLARLVTLATPGQCALPVVGAGSHLRQRVMRVLAFGATSRPLTRPVVVCAALLPPVIGMAVADVRIVSSVTLGTASMAAATVPERREYETLAGVSPTASASLVALPARPRRPATRSPWTTESRSTPAATAAGGLARGLEVASDAATTPGRQDPVGLADESLASLERWPIIGLRDGSAVAAASPQALPPTLEPRAATPWSAAATGGVAIGRGTQKAAVSTAGFFSRVGRTIAGSF